MRKQANNLLREVPGGVAAPCGFEAAGVRCGLKRAGLDLALIYSVAPAVAAGVFTTNRFQAASVLVCKDRVGRNVRGVIVNAGNANACTGPAGYHDAVRMADFTAAELDLLPRTMLVCSTGVIGQPLPMSKIESAIPKLIAELSPAGGNAAAEAILTTDTRPKSIAVEFELAGRPVRVGGIAKGSGMISPNLATMLAFITTDADLTYAQLHQCLKASADRSFNRITVDGDSSTNDSVLLFANRQAETGQITPRRGLNRFQAALDYVTAHLAQEIVRDGEGASKLVEVCVRGADTPRNADKVARTIANSTLVKTSLAGGDPNWGRILAAAGRAGVRFNPDLVELLLGKVCVFKDGAVVKYDKRSAGKAFGGAEVAITLDLHSGEEEATLWTCDLTTEYVKLNAEYRT